MEMFFIILSLLGGLALFLFGMNFMGEGLKNTAGGKLELLLERLSSTPIKGMLLGAAVTAVIQSSSATTVMVVGFVNSGIMKLSQATGIILGANVGTTITSWILSLSDIDGGELFFVRLFNPTSLSPILAFIGLLLFMVSKSRKNKEIGSILLGLGILLFGMEMMSEAVAPLADIPEFTNLLLAFSNPILGLLVGAFITAIIQSSSASIGILQALSLSGAVTFGTAIPIIMGQNLGTCITAVISSAGAKTNGKRAAFIHLYYNIVIVGLFMIIFYALNSFMNFAFLDELASPVGIACFHTAFNVVAFFAVAPFTKQLEKLVRRTVKGSKNQDLETELSTYTEHLNVLDERFLETPALAVSQGMSTANRMAEITKSGLQRAFSLLDEYSDKVFEKVKTREEAIDIFDDRLGTYIVKLSSKKMSDADSNKLSIMLHCISDFERISDHAMNIAESARKMSEQGLTFSEEGRRELSVFRAAVTEIVEMTVDVFTRLDVEKARAIEPLEEVIDNINERAKRHHVRRLQEGACPVEMAMHFDEITNDLERISDHCSNVAVCLIEIKENVYDAHEYIDTLKHTQSPEFQEMYRQYDEKFHL